jgi:flagellar hook-associated protein 1 FlgK
VPTLSGALEIGKSALRAQQAGLNVASNNIANVNTPGYSRQKAVLKTAITVGGVSSGVDLSSITRLRNRFLDGQLRFESGSLGRSEVIQRVMGNIETIFLELEGGGVTEPGAVFEQSGGAQLSGSMSRFFNAFQDLANNPESQAARASVKEEAIFLTTQFHRMHNKLSQLRIDIELDFQAAVWEANTTLSEIAKLNTAILATDTAGNLDDERDRLLDDLSKQMDVRVREENDGTFTVSAGDGTLLVRSATANELSTRVISRGNAVVSDLSLASSGKIIRPNEGAFKGLAEARDLKIPDFQGELDLVAETLVRELNAIHVTGFGLDGSRGTSFFLESGIDARSIEVSDEILNNLDKIAAAGPNGSNPAIPAGAGDSTVALALSDLRLARFFSGGTQSMEEYYAGVVGRIGAESRQAQNQVTSLELVTQQISTRRENVRGVSINEEAIDLIVFQRAYQAAARIISIVDQLMETALSI